MLGSNLPSLVFFSRHFLSLDFPTLPLLDRGTKGFTQQSLGARMCSLFVFYPCNAIFLNVGQLQPLRPSTVAEGRGTVL